MCILLEDDAATQVFEFLFQVRGSSFRSQHAPACAVPACAACLCPAAVLLVAPASGLPLLLCLPAAVYLWSHCRSITVTSLFVHTLLCACLPAHTKETHHSTQKRDSVPRSPPKAARGEEIDPTPRQSGRPPTVVPSDGCMRRGDRVLNVWRRDCARRLHRPLLYSHCWVNVWVNSRSPISRHDAAGGTAEDRHRAREAVRRVGHSDCQSGTPATRDATPMQCDGDGDFTDLP